MSSFHSLRMLTSFLFITVLILGSLEAPRAPLAILVIAIGLFGIGIPLSIYALRAMERFKDVFDYEPCEFWGRTRNGKGGRETLMTLSTAGLWCAFSGIALLLVVLLNLRVI